MVGGSCRRAAGTCYTGWGACRPMSAAPSLERHRPKTIVVIAIFLFAATIVALLVGESLLFPNTLLDQVVEIQSRGRGPVSFHWTAFRRVSAGSGCWDVLCCAGIIAETAVGLVVWRCPFRHGCMRQYCQLLSYPRCATFFNRRHRLCNIFIFLVSRFRSRLFSAPGAYAKP